MKRRERLDILSFSISSSSQRRHRRTRDFCNCTSANVYSDNHDTHIHSDYHLIIIMEERFLSPLQSYIFLVLFLLSTPLLYQFFFSSLPYLFAVHTGDMKENYIYDKLCIFSFCYFFILYFFFFCEGEKERSSERVFIIFHKENDQGKSMYEKKRWLLIPERWNLSFFRGFGETLLVINYLLFPHTLWQRVPGQSRENMNYIVATENAFAGSSSRGKELKSQWLRGTTTKETA